MKYFTCLLILLVLAPTGATAATYNPARIGDHETSLAKRIKFPEGEQRDLTRFIRCEAKIAPKGSVEETACYADPSVNEAFFRAVYLGASSATVQPATVDGEEVPLLMLFSVVFRQQDGQRVVAVVPNHGTNAKELGINYIAPQKYGLHSQYYPRGNIGLLWVDAMMSEEGKAKDIKYIDTEWSDKETKRYGRAYITKNRFIPGHLNGEPKAMRFVKPIYGYRNGFTVDGDSTKCRDSAMAVCDERSARTDRPRFVFDD